jgi:hypothetical protein
MIKLVSRPVITASFLLAITNAFGAAPAENLDSGLSILSDSASSSIPDAGASGVHSQIAPVNSEDKAIIFGRFDDQDRILVHVMLNGQNTVDQVAAQVETLQGLVLGTDSTYRHGILAAYLPTDQLNNVANLPGVRALTMEHPPVTRVVGKYSSQSIYVFQTTELNSQGLTGQGITIGALSDSFNTARFDLKHPPATTAQKDEKLGYLPKVKVLEDYGEAGHPGTDEGRAILQIAYAEAPQCNEAFATAYSSEVNFAKNIVRLRTEAKCSIIDDDVGYYDEPVFSDGIVSKAVDEVVNTPNSMLAGVPVIYTSSAGNDGNNGYRSPYRELSDSEVRKGNHGNLKLDHVDQALTAGGWHNWNPNGGFEPSTTIFAPGKSRYSYNIFLQWDDPFDVDHGVTNRYNLLVFDADGNYLGYLSGTTNSFKTEQPFQYTGRLHLNNTYQFAITKTTETDSKAPPPPATHQLALYTTLDGLSVLLGPYFIPAPLNVPIIYGHPAASSAIAVAAYDFNWQAAAPPYLPELENYTTPGPAYIYFDENHVRLASPEVRSKPEIAGLDGVITDFFVPPAYYNSQFAFFGTSAAGPTVAGVVALMLEQAGGPASLDVDTVKTDLENSAPARTSTPGMTQAAGSNNGASVTVTALGSFWFGPSFLTINFNGPSGEYISTVTIDGSAAELVFDTTSKDFIIGNLVGLQASDVTVQNPSTAASSFTLQFTSGAFTSGASISFTVGQNEAGTYAGYTQSEYGVGSDAEDLGWGATLTANLAGTSNATITGSFQPGTSTTGYSQADGYGLINAISAVGAVPKPERAAKTKNASSK